MRIGLVAFSLSLALGAATGGCKSDTLGQNPGTGGAGGPGTGTGGAGGCGSDLSGTWDVMATRPANPSGTRAWVMTINATTFSMSDSSGALVYTDGATKQLTWTQFGAAFQVVTPVTVTNVPAALNTGSVPLALGGSWTFSSLSTSSPAYDKMCAVSVSAASVTALCQGPQQYVGGGGNWPNHLPSPMNGRTYTASRISPMASQVGDLGGQWQLSNGAEGSCTAVLQGNSVTATCTNAQPLTGTLQLTLGSDCVASGSSGGYELSARRR